jgi:hypothetical protein
LQLQPLINPDYDGGVADLAAPSPHAGGGCGMAPGAAVGLLPVVCIVFVACRRRRDAVRHRS